ncbi:MAG: prepilin-type N-terminal cleavage/methylation domain-containing protein [Verrucomicrobiales bacterium]|nr:prepilin-type N-terminal cleavage/methylation domain-containing protein [Verrucomicrobiales bacterium]
MKRAPAIAVPHSRGLTMVEILVVVAILGILVGIGVPSYRMMKANARSTLCAGKLREIGIALNQYFGDHGMTYPTLVAARESREQDDPSLDTVLLEYLGDEFAFQCPADHELFEKTGSSYFWNSLVNGQKTSNLELLGMKGHPSGIPLVSDKENFHEDVGDGVNVLYGDGHVLREVQFVVERN